MDRNQIYTVGAISSETMTTGTDGSYSGSIALSQPRILEKIFYDRGDLVTGCDITVVDGDSGETFWTQENLGTNDLVKYPKLLSQGSTGTDISTEYQKPFTKSLSITLVQGGDTKTGVLYAYWR